jgi:hypothetical protein
MKRGREEERGREEKREAGAGFRPQVSELRGTGAEEVEEVEGTRGLGQSWIKYRDSELPRQCRELERRGAEALCRSQATSETYEA